MCSLKSVCSFLFLVFSCSFLIAQSKGKKATTPLHHGVSRFAKPEYVVPDLAERLAKYKRVVIPFDKSRFSARELQMIDKLVDASRYLDDIFWRQSDPEGLALYKSLENSKSPRDIKLRQFLMINGSRFDLTNDNKPFVGTKPMPPGRGLYPDGLTREELKKYVADPRVTVVVTAMNSQKVYLTGEVLHPGPTALTPNMTVLQALAGAGFTQFANTKGIYVLRTQNGKQHKIPVNYKKLIKGEAVDQNLMLKPGDTVVVP